MKTVGDGHKSARMVRNLYDFYDSRNMKEWRWGGKGEEIQRVCDGQSKGEECSKIMVIRAQFIARREHHGDCRTFDDVIDQ